MMITLSGIVTHKGDGYAVVETGGVGYQVHMNKPSLQALRQSAEAKLWTHEYLREDSRELYGFATEQEHRLFLRLLAISGVGPKMAMNILSLGSVKDIETKIEHVDVDWLTRVPGVGKKTAQKIVLELKGKLVVSGESGDGNEEVLAALVNLGYNRDKAREALSTVGGDGKGVEDQLRAALRELGR